MFSPNKNNSPLISSFEEPVYQNHRNIRNIESHYLSDEYNKSISSKAEKLQEQKQRKRMELQLYNRKNQEYLNSVAVGRYQKHQQRQFMADQYDEMINRRRMKQLEEKRNEKAFERELLAQPTWILDAHQQRQWNKRKVQHYSKELENHVRAQEQRISQQITVEKQWKERINEQAKQILDKEYQELQQRQMRKNKFEQRQNQLLGIQSNPQLEGRSSLSGSRLLEEISMRKKQQEIYGMGLQSQVQINQQRRKKVIEDHFKPGPAYNPITNPLPVVYKNPNVLRMLVQK